MENVTEKFKSTVPHSEHQYIQKPLSMDTKCDSKQKKKLENKIKKIQSDRVDERKEKKKQRKEHIGWSVTRQTSIKQ